jgi:hypothetical protein
LVPKDLLTTTLATKEAKTTQKQVKLGWFGLFVELLGRISTGSSFSATRSHNLTLLTTLYHFVPHLTRKSLIVKRKLEGTVFAVALSRLTTTPCG